VAKFLFIRFSSIGDIVLTSPVLRCLKQQLPGSEIHFLVKSKFIDVVKNNPNIDKLQVFAHSEELLLEELRTENYDHIIDLQRNRTSIRITKALKVPARKVNKLNIRKYLLTALKINFLPNAHIVDRYMQTLRTWGIKNDGKGLDYFITDAEKIKQRDIPASHAAGYIACVIGAAHFTKRFPIHKWRSFCEQMNHPIILLGDQSDTERGAEISAIDTVKIYNACGKFSLNESADLIQKSKLVISNDTGLMHIASAYRKPIISLWGNTVPAFGMYPYYGDYSVPAHRMEIKKLWCRPCSKIGYKKCPLGHFKCMEKIEVGDLYQRASDLLQMK
jgi:ADP-heptose:LPS heptosyltransferase